MNVYLAARRAEHKGYCDIHGGWVAKGRFVAVLIVRHDNNVHTNIRGCRPCFRAAARIAGPQR